MKRDEFVAVVAKKTPVELHIMRKNLTLLNPPFMEAKIAIIDKELARRA